jgi:L-lysine exporter family protein LysE/ArgO
MFFLSTFFNGLGLGAGLIMAIGAQNVHVLRAGIKRQHVALTVMVCITLDVLLICIGVAGVGSLVQASPLLLGLARWGGAAFLLWYGLRSWRAVFSNATLKMGEAHDIVSTSQALLSVMAISLLNPHVYLDTVVLLGAIGGHFPVSERPSFALGASCASLLWFVSLGFGARGLSRLFSRPVAWKWIDALTGTTMFVLSGSIAFGS